MIKKVGLENWKSYREEELVFDGGVNALVGEMGSGKSSVLESIVFGLYGTLPSIKERRINIDDVIRRSPNQEDSAKVKIVFEIEDTYSVERIIKRGRGTTKSILRKEGDVIAGPQATEVSEKIEEIIGLNFDLFTTIVFSEQNSLDFFLDMRPGERKEKIDKLLGLDRFEKARKSLVKLKNSVRNKREYKESDLKDNKESFEEKDFEKIMEKRGKIEDKIEELEDRRKKLSEKKQVLNEKYESEKKAKKKHEKLERKIGEVKGEINSLKENLDELEEELEEINIEDKDKIDKKISEIDEKISKAEKVKERLSKKKNKVGYKDKNIGKIEKKIEELNEDKEEFEKLEDVEKSIEKKKKKLDDNKDKISGLKSKKQNLDDSIEQLSDAEGKCPTCNRDLDDEHREELIISFREEKKNLESRKESIGEKIEEISEELQKLNNRRADILKLGDVEEKISDKKKKLREERSEKKVLSGKIEELEEKLKDLNREKLKEEKERMKKLKDVFKFKKKLEERRKALTFIEKSREENDFDIDRFKNIEKKFNDVKSDIRVVEKEKESKKEVLEQYKKRVEELKERKSLIDDIEEDIERYRILEDFFVSFRKKLKEAQEQLRKQFIENLNDVMQDIWANIYPYDYYSDIEISVEEDYILKICDSRGNKVPVEGEVSGGERHSAALTMRLALSAVLGKRFNVLMLDEPTHNLDERTVSDLSDTLREDISIIVDQLLLITHDKDLEDSVTSYLYRVSKEGSGISVSEEIYMEQHRP